MSKGIGFLVLLETIIFLFCTEAYSSQSPPAAGDILDGREVAVRVFPEWEKERWSYDTIILRVDGNVLNFDISRAGYSSSAVGVLLRADQTDNVVKGFVDSDAQMVSPGSEIELSRGRGRSIEMCFLDGPAHPVAFATGEIFQRVGDEGQEKIMATFLLDQSGKARWRYTTNKTTKYYVRVRHPYFGEWTFASPLNKTGYTWRIPMAQPGTAEYERSLRGVILDDANEPLEGVLFHVERIVGPGDNLLHARGSARSDSQGFFQMYPVVSHESRAAYGDMIPANCCYDAWIEPPRESSMMAGHLCLLNTQLHTVYCLRGKFHTFAFEDGSRRLTAKDGINTFRLVIDRPNGRQYTYEPKRFAKGVTLPPGTYSVDPWGQNYDFEPVVVTEDSPEEIVFRTKVPSSDVVRYTGRLVDGVTGDLIGGGFVVTANSGLSPDLGPNFAEFTPEQWEKLRTLPMSFSVRTKIADVLGWSRNPLKDLKTFAGVDLNEIPDIEEAIVPVNRLWEVSKGVRTDSDGRFEIEIQRGEKFERLLFFEEGYLSILLKKYSLFDDGDGVVDVGAIPLFPAAKVIVHPKIVGGRRRIVPLWLLDPNDCPEWACGPKRIIPDMDTLNDPAALEKLLAEASEPQTRKIPRLTDYGYGMWENFGYSQDITYNKKKVVNVPANLKLRIHIMPVMDRDHEWVGYTYPQTIFLNKGQTLDLGECEIHKSIHVYVKVVDPQGKPVEGIYVSDPVGEDLAPGQFMVGHLQHLTDMNGYVRFNVYRGMKGKFKIGCDRHKIFEMLDFEVGDEIEEGHAFVFEISEELKRHMLGDPK